MKWTVKLVAEGRSSVEHEVITIERSESISPGTVGLTIAEGKVILERLQRARCAQPGAGAIPGDCRRLTNPTTFVVSP